MKTKTAPILAMTFFASFFMPPRAVKAMTLPALQEESSSCDSLWDTLIALERALAEANYYAALAESGLPDALAGLDYTEQRLKDNRTQENNDRLDLDNPLLSPMRKAQIAKDLEQLQNQDIYLNRDLTKYLENVQKYRDYQKKYVPQIPILEGQIQELKRKMNELVCNEQSTTTTAAD